MDEVELVFFTSSNEKLEHARYLCRNYNVQISKQKHYGIGYKEPRISDREKLLEESIRDAIDRWKKDIKNTEKKLFFIEDTSVIIHALSKEEEYPGVDVKYWMQSNDFLSVDEELKSVGNDRRATVRSDLILILSDELKNKTNSTYKRFTSCVEGKIVDREFEIETQPLYPWLNNKTFNKWFVPNGCQEPLSLLPINIADQYDFRVSAFQKMLSFLEKNNIISKRCSQYHIGRQKKLEFEPLLYIVCGPTCAGKTTIATFLAEKYNYYHFEASDYMYLSYYQRHGVYSSVKISDFAEEALIKNPSIVVNQIIRDINELINIPIIITGFRSPREIEIFKRQYRGTFNIEIDFVDAEQSIRYARCKLRNRIDVNDSFTEFKNNDEQQENMGLKEIRNEFSSKIINNNSDLETYYKIFTSGYSEQLKMLSNYLNQDSGHLEKPSRLEDLIILSLAEKFETAKYFTTTEITNLLNRRFKSLIEKEKNKNNVSRYFNKDFHPFYEIHINKSRKRCYRLSQTGFGRANWFLKNKYKF
ncbi:MAG: non-canonical purine NTP pyrophosphatase [Candidatus Aminicenantes bacterium]|jgi:inosine/xanthosine triphosphate pyrophosphatase family protein/adenylate kinase family enzyme